MPQITVSQFFIMLFLCRSFSFFTIVPGLREATGGSAGLASLVLFVVFSVIIMLPSFLILRRQKGVGLIEYAYQRSQGAGFACATLFALLALSVAIDNVVHFAIFITSAVYPNDSNVIFVVLFTLVALYMVYLGLESTARFSGLALVLLLASIVMIVLSLAREFDTVGLVSPFLNGLKPVVQGGVVSVNETSELMLVLLFIPYLKGNVKKGFLWWVLGVFALLEGMIFVTLCTVGQYAVTQSYPLYAVAKMARLFYFQRMDAVHMVVWTMIGLIKTTLYLFIAQRCLCFLFGAKRKNLILLVLGGITILCSLLLTHYFTAYQALYNFTLTGIPLYVAVLLAPVLLLLIPGRRRKGDRT